MNIRILFGSSAVAATVAALLTASPAAAALTDAQLDCRGTVVKTYSKLMKTAVKTITGCHKSRNKDAALAGTNCNSLAEADAEKGKFAAAVDKAVVGLGDSCADDTLTAASNDGYEWYISCPVTCPGADAEIPGEPMTTMEQVAECQACVITDIVETVGAATLGSPTPPLSAENAKCHGAIAKGYGKLMNTALKAETSCQKTADGAGGDGQYAGCANNDEKGKVADATLKAGIALTDACTGNLADLGGCATDSVANLKTCTETAWETAEDDAYDAVYEFPTLTCPNTIRTTVRAGCSVDGTDPGNCSSGHATGTQLSLGWKGLAHGVDTIDHFTLAGYIDCPGTPGACGTCNITGVSRDNPQFEDFTRCLSDTSIKCNSPFGTDPVCPGSQACRTYLGPPLAVSVGLTPTCSVNIVREDITGTVEPDTGISSFQIKLAALVHSGEAQQRPCPICINDTVAQDGIRNGTCLGGALHPGDPCDVQGFDLTFAPTNADNPVNGPSLDCPPDNGGNISGSGLKITLPLTTGQSQKAGTDPCDPPNAALSCFCGICSGDTTEPCDTDAYCAGLGKGVCGTGDVLRNPNNCSDGVCTDIGATDRGKCDADIDSYCEGLLFANGKGILACGDDSTCDSYISGSSNPWDWVCQDNDCGTCTHQSFRSCFLNPIVTEGTPSTTNPILVGTFCLPPSSNLSVNETTGSPGPGIVKTDALAELRY